MTKRKSETEYSVRQLPSLRWQGRFEDSSGVRRSAGAFETEKEALEAAMGATLSDGGD